MRQMDLFFYVENIGYGTFGGGIDYRLVLDIKYTVVPEKIKLLPKRLHTIYKYRISADLRSGYDASAEKVYSYKHFELS